MVTDGRISKGLEVDRIVHLRRRKIRQQRAIDCDGIQPCIRRKRSDCVDLILLLGVAISGRNGEICRLTYRRQFYRHSLHRISRLEGEVGQDWEVTFGRFRGDGQRI